MLIGAACYRAGKILLLQSCYRSGGVHVELSEDAVDGMLHLLGRFLRPFGGRVPVLLLEGVLPVLVRHGVSFRVQVSDFGCRCMFR